MFALAATPAQGAPGDLDASFGNQGFAVQGFGLGSDFLHDLAVLPDDSIVGVGVTNGGHSTRGRWTVARYTGDGAIDPFSADHGRWDGPASPYAVTTSSAGVLVAGDVGLTEDLGLVRYRYDGSIDKSFGGGGGQASLHVCPTFWGVGDVVARNGKETVAGICGYGFFVARFNHDGFLDNSFGNAGVQILDVRGTQFVSKVALVVGRRAMWIGGTIQKRREYNSLSDFALVKLRDDGSVDRAFGTDGLVRTRFRGPRGGYGRLAALVRTRAGRLVAAGRVAPRAAFVRYRSNGEIDRSFGHAGKTLVQRERHRLSYRSEDLSVTDLLVQPDGKLVGVGTGQRARERIPRVAVIRLLKDGSLDARFGNRGRAYAAAPGSARPVIVAGGRQADGKIIAGGYTDVFDAEDWLLARFDG